MWWVEGGGGHGPSPARGRRDARRRPGERGVTSLAASREDLLTSKQLRAGRMLGLPSRTQYIPDDFLVVSVGF